MAVIHNTTPQYFQLEMEFSKSTMKESNYLDKIYNKYCKTMLKIIKKKFPRQNISSYTVFSTKNLSVTNAERQKVTVEAKTIIIILLEKSQQTRIHSCITSSLKPIKLRKKSHNQLERSQVKGMSVQMNDCRVSKTDSTIFRNVCREAGNVNEEL
jgi:hypothetical protein